MKRRKGVLRVRLYEPGGKWQYGHPGFGQKFKIPELVKSGSIATTHFNASGLSLAGQERLTVGRTPAVGFNNLTDGMGGISSYPYLDAGQDIGLEYWQTVNGDWEEISDEKYPGHAIFNRDATAEMHVAAQSTFWLPPMPHIIMNLWRGEPNADHDSTAHPPYTSIAFGCGNTQFALIIPYDSSAYMAYWDAVNSRWQPTPAKSGTLAALSGIGASQRQWIEIGCWWGCIFVKMHRGSGSESSWTCYEIPDTFWYDDYGMVGAANSWQQTRPRFVPSGPIRISHVGGQIMFRWWPTYMYPSDTYARWTGSCDAAFFLPVYPGWGIQDDYQIDGDSCTAWQTRLWQWASYAAGGSVYQLLGTDDIAIYPWDPAWDADPLQKLESSSYWTWFAQWAPHKWILLDGQEPDPTGTSEGIAYYQSPMLCGVQVIGEPMPTEVVRNDFERITPWPSYTDISGDVLSVRVTSNEGSSVTTAEVTLKNLSGSYSLLQDWQLITIEMGYEWDNDSTDLDINPLIFAGYIVSSGKTGQVQAADPCSIVAYCPMIRLRDEKATGMEPDFQLHTAKAAIEWLAKRAGFSDDQLNLLGSDTAMCYGEFGADADTSTSAPDPRNDSLLPAFGSELIRSCEEYARRDAESLLYLTFDATDYGTDEQILWKLNKTNGALGSTDGILLELAEDYDDSEYASKYPLRHFSVDDIGVDASKYADHVALRGVTDRGERIQVEVIDYARLTDTSDADFNGGWRHGYAEVREHLKTAAALRTRAEEILTEHKRKPTVCTAHTDILHAVNKTNRFTLTNAAASGHLSNAGIRNSIWRVVGYTHTWDSRTSWPRTELRGRSLD